MIDIENISSTNCSQFKDDLKVTASFPFRVKLNSIRVPTMAYGTIDLNRHITSLDITNKNFVPLTIFCLKHLRKLYIENTSFSKMNYRLPMEIDHFASTLTELSIFHTKLTHLSEQIGKLKYLRSLELINTSLMTLPDSIGNLSSLILLDLRENQLISLPKTIRNIPSLSRIMLKNNPNFESAKSLDGLSNLAFLGIDSCSMKRLPFNLPHLSTLYMSDNQLTSLAGISSLGNETNERKYFNFYKNRIEVITPEIQDVNNLFWLKLNHNLLHALPFDLYCTTTLRYLFIGNNQFSTDELNTIVATFNITNPNLYLEI